MKKLYAVMLGGRVENCNIELHDVVFVAADNLENAYPDLIKKWFGSKNRLHIDASVELTQVDGYNIQLSKIKTALPEQKLFFVNFGGYKPGVFNETHHSAFYVAESKNAALQRAKQELCLNLSEQHCDDNLIVDDLFELNTVDHFYIHLEKASVITPLEIKAKYIKIANVVANV